MRNALRITVAVGGAVLAAAAGFARGGEVAAGQSMSLPRPERASPATGISGGTVVGPYIGAIGLPPGLLPTAEAGPPPAASPPAPATRGLPALTIRDPAGESRLNDAHRP